MKLKLLATCKLGQCGSVIEMDSPERARQLIAKKVAEEVKEEKKQTKGGKKPASKEFETK